MANNKGIFLIIDKTMYLWHGILSMHVITTNYVCRYMTCWKNKGKCTRPSTFKADLMSIDADTLITPLQFWMMIFSGKPSLTKQADRPWMSASNQRLSRMDRAFLWREIILRVGINTNDCKISENVQMCDFIFIKVGMKCKRALFTGCIW